MPTRRNAPLVAAIAGVTVFAACLVLLAAPLAQTVRAASATVSVDAASNVGSLQTQMSTNLVWNTIPDVAGAQASLDALAPQLVRIHAGDDGTTPATAPDQTKGNWGFSNLDALIGQVHHYGAQPFLNIKFAPDWQWTCSSPDTGQTGQVRDQTYQEFAQYMARLVSYYNVGTMTDENGVVHTNPSGTANRITYWEIWNEPDGAWETPCVPPASLDPGGEALTPAQYVTMWNAVAPAMKAVDPTVKLIGPVTANPTTGHTPDYIPDLIAHATVLPDVLSYHGYGGWTNSESDAELLVGGSDSEGLDGIVADHATIAGWDTPGIPIWFSEGNVNADWGVDSHHRSTNQYGVAYGASEFAQFAYQGVGVISDYDFIDSAQYGDISDQNGALRLAYWRDMLLTHDFPVGSTLLSVTNTLRPGVTALGVKRPDGSVVVLLANRQPDNSTILGGAGLGGTVSVSLANFTPTAVTLQQIDATTSVTSGPPVVTEPTSASQSVTFGGYGMAVLTFSGSAGTPTDTPTTGPTATPTNTPTNTPTPTATATPPPSGIVNGNFETGSLSGWTFTGAASSVSATDKHGGSYGAVLGKVGTYSNGASNLAQTFTAPAGSTTLTIWYENHNPSVTGTPWDYSKAVIKDNTTGVSTTLFNTCPATLAWRSKVWTSIVAGHSYTLTLTNYSSNTPGDEVWTVFDDVATS